MRPLRYSINVTLDGCCDHRAVFPDEDLHRHAVENLNRADALLFGRVTYEMMEAAARSQPYVPLCLLCSQTSDVITAIDGTAVTNASQSERRDRREEPRRPMRFTYPRDGKTKTAPVTLGTRPS
jgi:predicted ABC-class ATPase